MSEEIVPSRERRKASKQLSKKLSALDRLRQLKGQKNKYELADEDNVYEEVDEEEYSEIVSRRQREDWIVDDDGCGYADTGREIFDDDFDEQQTHSSAKYDSSHKKRNPTKGSLISRDDDEKKAPKKTNNIREMFMKGMETNRSAKAVKDVVIDEKELDGIIDSIHSTSSRTGDHSKRITMSSTPKAMKLTRRVTQSPSNPFAVNTSSSSAKRSSKRVSNGFSEPPMKKRSLMSEGDYDFDSILNSDGFDFEMDLKPNITEVDVKRDDNKTSDQKAGSGDQLELNLSGGEWVVSNQNNDIQSLPIAAILPKEVPFEFDDHKNKLISFYWFDAYIDYFRNPSVVYLFGKVFIKDIKRFVSCCIQVRNIERKIYLLPREHFLDDETQKVTLQDVYNEFNDVIAKKYKISQFKSRKVTKKYSFDNKDIPAEAEYLEVLYPATHSPLPPNLTSGKTFRHVFGVNTSGLENLLLDCKLVGPQWLTIKNPEIADPPVSWCKLELIVNKASAQISVDTEQKASPDFTLVSLNMKTFVNPNTKLNEIISISCLVNSSFNFHKPNVKTKYDSHFCVITKPSNNCGVTLPYDFSPKMALKNYHKTKVEPMNSERELLNYFMAKILQLDPDIIVGHDIYHFDYDLLLSRFAHYKISMSWSKLGRLKRSGVPNKAKDKGGLCGRIVCDIKISSKELIRAKSYDLTQLSTQILKKSRFEVEQHFLSNYFSTSNQLLRLVDLIMKDNDLIINIMYELNALPLALQITSIAGNLLSRTLLGGRSERNEYLLLHAFHERNFISPDKVFSNSKFADFNDFDTNGDPMPKKATASRQKKAAYTGGLVLEPKVGFYDKYILLMDFNSLYPSIIQEFNICFTTVSQTEPKEDENENTEEYIPDLPDADLPEGILPNEIKKLVESRREVKKLMCNPDLTPDLKQQYDIRQKALKLTANSMYGCLGFSYSRFYAKPLAALVTFKGREILMNTKQLVEKIGLEVIYGDTDSIMILTNCTNYNEVKTVGNKVQIEVNRLYRLLEIDIDGVFRSMLLLKKKKYAALTVQKAPNGELSYVKEVKGLDIVRRDWSILAKKAGERILDEILSTDKSSELIVDNIHSYLKELSESIRRSELPIEEFVISKALTKNPEEYPDKKGLSHVSVALRYNESSKAKKLRNGDTVAYVICEDDSGRPATQRAYHCDELKEKNLKIDVNYYLSQQLLPVVSRLCEPIDGTDSHILAEFMGIESNNKFNNRSLLEVENAIERGEHKYDLCKPLVLKCVNESCNQELVITTVFKKTDNNEAKDGESDKSLTKKRLELSFSRCPHCNIEFTELMAPKFEVQIRRLINEFIGNFYQKWMICDDQICSHRTRYLTGRLSKVGPLCPKCKSGNLCPEISEFQLNLQLTYFKHLMDLSPTIKLLTTESDKMDGKLLKARNNDYCINYVLKAQLEPKDVTTDEFQLDCLLNHNKNREKHCSSPLKYSPKLKLFATKRATLLATNGGKNFGSLHTTAFGENSLVMKYENSTPIDCKRVVENWYKERVKYSWKSQKKISPVSKHFAQMVWNSTQRIGCASVLSDTFPFKYVSIVCTYYNAVPFGRNITQNVRSVKKCDQILSTHGQWIQECIKEHNRIRKLHSVDPLVINDEIFQSSHKRAIGMAQKGFRFFRHKNSEFGENIHWTSAAHMNGSQPISCSDSIGKWYGEVINYDWDYRQSHNGTVRHFIQLVWSPTTTVGCAQVQNIEEPKGGVYTVCLYKPKADFTVNELQWENVFPDYSINKEVQTESTVTAKAHDYEHIDELDDETELEKEFKDVDDIIDTRNAVQRQTPAPSLEDMFIKTTTQKIPGFDRNEYIHKKNG
ncbi:unnamed protein product [Oppiella nova]|uniref:DNA polymerase n=1 Tax=Oppiella nova TaxID=334625 RepID=A0A7R9LS09_9ACAR|nr:unnamed protein product [Oppiella nova]CAG2165802.1 unnamed protein product [Oppiella nova]